MSTKPGAGHFEGKTIEPRPEDNEWIANSWIDELSVAASAFVEQTIVYLRSVAEVRDSKSKLFLREPQLSAPSTYTKEFIAQGPPRIVINERTGREQVVPRNREIKRDVFNSGADSDSE